MLKCTRVPGTESFECTGTYLLLRLYVQISGGVDSVYGLLPGTESVGRSWRVQVVAAAPPKPEINKNLYSVFRKKGVFLLHLFPRRRLKICYSTMQYN